MWPDRFNKVGLDAVRQLTWQSKAADPLQHLQCYAITSANQPLGVLPHVLSSSCLCSRAAPPAAALIAAHQSCRELHRVTLRRDTSKRLTSSTSTRLLGFADSRLASTQPAAPPPTMM